MKRSTFPILISTLLFVSCSGSKDDQFCKCLKASEELNELSNDVLSGGVDQHKADKLKELKAQKKEACKDYTTMGGKEMLERKSECSE